MSLDYRVRASKHERAIAHLCYEGIDTPLSLSCSLLLKYGEIEQLVQKRIHPKDYNDPRAFADDYQAVSLLTKTKLQSTKIDQEKAAYDKYLAAEASCRATNDRMTEASLAQSHPFIFLQMKRHIARILGRVPSDLFDRCQFGKGSTVGVSGIVTYGRKYDKHNLDLTPELLGAALRFLPPMWRERVTTFTCYDYAKLDFVPKNALTHRPIEKQPTFNIWMQKGIGSAIRERLAKFGVELDSQERNQELAQMASANDALVTLDLSSASDHISYNLVKELLPRSWFELCDLTRTKYAQCRNDRIPLEKFSAMGNGFTFELETLIFYAALLAVRDESQRDNVCYDLISMNSYLPGNVGVYGDDLIFPKHWYGSMLTTLDYLGFKVNHEKTFGETYFRESCGADFFDGVNVRPIFFRNNCANADDFIELSYLYANHLLNYAYRRNGGNGRDSRFRAAWLSLYTRVPKRLRFRVPAGYEANGFLGSFDESLPSLRRERERDGWQGYRFSYRARPPARTMRYRYGKLMATLSGLNSDFSFGEEELRGRKLPATTRQGYALAWPDFGPWN